MSKKKIFILTSVIVVVLILGIVVTKIILDNKETKKVDGEKFAKEYTEVDSNNVFVYRDIDEIINILEHGTGIVYLGFPECPWCQSYVKYLNEVATDMGVEEIYYYDILEDRQENTDNYLKIVDLINEYLQYDKEGKKRIYVPSVITLKKGEIIGFDDETAWDTKGFTKPADYWTDNEVKDLKEKLETIINASGVNICTECNK